jgi:hypothetical protein
MFFRRLRGVSAGRVQSILLALLLIIPASFLGRLTAANSERPQAAIGDVLSATSAIALGASSGAHLSGNGSPQDFSPLERANAIVVGDFNGDGIMDVAIGAPDQDVVIPQTTGPPVVRARAGEVYIIFGTSSIPATPPATASLDTIDTLTGTGVNVSILGGHAGDSLGFSLAVGDVNEDGTTDLIIGAPNASFNGTNRANTGAVFVVLGSKSLTSTSTIDFGTGSGPDVTIFGASTGDQFGSSVGAGNVGGPQPVTSSTLPFADIVVGAPGASIGAIGSAAPRSQCGLVYAIFSGDIYGSSTTPSNPVIDITNPQTPPNAEIVGASSGDSLGVSVGVGIINGTQPADIVAGAPNATRPGTLGVSGAPNPGAVYGVFGGVNLNPTVSLPRIIDVGQGQQNLSIYGINPGDRMGASLAIGDVTGDGNPDIVIGAPDANSTTNSRPGCGQVYVIAGGVGLFPNGIISQRVDPILAITNPTVTANLTTLLAFGSAPGDHLGAAVAVGSYDITGFENTVPDLLMGAPGYGSGEGAVSIIFGGSGLVAAPIRDLGNGNEDVRITGEEANVKLGATFKLSETITTTDTRLNPQLLDLTATINGTSYTETSQADFAAGTLTGVASGSTGGGDLQLSPNPGLIFNATNGLVDIPINGTLQPGTSDWTVEFWLNGWQPGASTDVDPVISSRESYASPSEDGWAVAIDHGTGQMHAVMGDGTKGFDVTSTGTVNNSLQHWAVTFIRSTSQVFFYKNGVFDSGVTIPPPNLPSVVNESVPVILGSDALAGSRFLNSTLDDVRVYNTARSATAVASDFAAEVPGSSANLVGYWTFNEGSGTVVHDSTADSNNGVLSGSGVAFTTATQRVLPTGTRISPTIPIFLGIGPVTSSLISWNANLPAGTSVQVQTSFDNGQTFQGATNGGVIPSINLGDGLGWAMAAADVNADGAGDLIIGAPFTTQTISGATRVQGGTVYILPGNFPPATPSPSPTPTPPSPPTVAITAPNGGDTLLVGHPFNIVWTASDPAGDAAITNFEIDLSTDGGNTFATTLAGAIPGTSRSFSWNVPTGLTTTQGRIRIIVTDASNLTATAVSANNFTITDQGVAVTLASPTGGEEYKFGQVVTVSWSVDASDQNLVEGFDLLLSTDGGVSFPLKIANAANPAQPALGPGVTSFNWTVPAECTTNAEISVIATSITGITTSSISSTPFTIDDYGPSVKTTKMSFPKATGEMTFVIGEPVTGPQVLFATDATIEVSSDTAGTQFFPFSKPPNIKGNGMKLITVGKLDGKKPDKFFPNGDSRVIRITNPTCASTILQVTRHNNELEITPGSGSEEEWRASIRRRQ